MRELKTRRGWEGKEFHSDSECKLVVEGGGKGGKG